MRSKNYASKKYLILLAPLLSASTCLFCQSESSNTSLSNIVLNKVLSKDREGQQMIVFTNATDAEIQSLVKQKPEPLWNYIKNIFGVSDDIGVAHILSTHHSSRLLFKEKTKKITLINATGDAKQRAVLHAIKQPLHAAIVDLLIVLNNKLADKCLIYYHIINEGFTLALLDRKNSVWNVAEFKVETLE